MKSYHIIKRIFDISFSFILMIVLLPVLFLTSILVYFFHGTPLLFKQSRPGYKGKTFTIFKFRTMKESLDDDGNLLPDCDRLTRFGKFLRKTSLDELPEIFNVFTGDMSFVGPRPLLMEYLEIYSKEQNRRHDVKPGITGLAQVNGRNEITWQKKFELDVYYVDNNSFWMDLKIICLTIKIVLLSQGINSPGEATTKYFMGNED